MSWYCRLKVIFGVGFGVWAFFLIMIVTPSPLRCIVSSFALNVHAHVSLLLVRDTRAMLTVKASSATLSRALCETPYDSIEHHSSVIIHHSSFIMHHSSLIIHHPSSIIHHSSSTVHHSSFIIHHSSFIIRHSSFIIRHSPCTIHHSPSIIQYSLFVFIIHLPSPIIHHSPSTTHHI